MTENESEADHWYSKYENQCHRVDGLEAKVLSLKSIISRYEVGFASLDNPWDRAPDETGSYVQWRSLR